MAEGDHGLARTLAELDQAVRAAFRGRDRLSSVQFSFEEKGFKKKPIIEEEN
jgi:hypothetical protein